MCVCFVVVSFPQICARSIPTANARNTPTHIHHIHKHTHAHAPVVIPTLATRPRSYSFSQMRRAESTARVASWLDDMPDLARGILGAQAHERLVELGLLVLRDLPGGLLHVAQFHFEGLVARRVPANCPTVERSGVDRGIIGVMTDLIWVRLK